MTKVEKRTFVFAGISLSFALFTIIYLCLSNNVIDITPLLDIAEKVTEL